MPLFERNGSSLALKEQTNFDLEKELQQLIEGNLETVFSCRFVATEFSTGVHHAGRIDTLALSEDGNPVIIEYKKAESSELITQSLYYLHWLSDHKGDFQLAAQDRLGSDVEIDWSGIRVICLAPKYKKFDLHAVQAMQATIELWRYRLFANNVLYIEEVFTPTPATSLGTSTSRASQPAVKKAASASTTSVYSVDDYLKSKPVSVQRRFHALREFIMSVDDGVDEVPKKLYVAYKAAKNFVCLEARNKKIAAFSKLDPTDFTGDHDVQYRDVTNVGHYGTGNAEITVELDVRRRRRGYKALD